MKDTILHEIAHALAPAREGHGRIWKNICVKIGANPTRCYSTKNVIQPKGKYIVLCTNCGYTRQAHRKKKAVACGRCCKAHNNGKYTEKFKLEYKKNT